MVPQSAPKCFWATPPPWTPLGSLRRCHRCPIAGLKEAKDKGGKEEDREGKGWSRKGSDGDRRRREKEGKREEGEGREEEERVG